MGKSKSSRRFGRSHSSNLSTTSSDDQLDHPRRNGSHRRRKSGTEGDSRGSELARSGSTVKKSRRSLVEQSKRDSMASITEEQEGDFKKDDEDK